MLTFAMKIIRLQRKPVLIVAMLCLCTLLWTVYSVVNKSSVRNLRTTKKEFSLHGKPFRILSGAIHYFRVVPEYWRDRLFKLKSMGLNTVETYVPWNLHEEIKGQFSFEGILDIRKFIKTAHELGLYVIVRPGPYICAEWDLGGLPSWLLHDPAAELRSMYPPFILAVERYFDELLPLLASLQFSKGGPIIAFQVENEYGSSGHSSKYMQHLKELMLQRSITELLFTSDGIKQMEEENHYVLENVLKTVNFQKNETSNLQRLAKLQPEKPLMVMEYWSGWFDHWGEQHHILRVDKTAARVTRILQMGASINFYMFHGGTNFGFMNGANGDEKTQQYKPTITSYDYDAPLSEAGDITPKYKALRAAIEKAAPRDSIPRDLPRIPPNPKREVYETVEIQYYMPLADLLHYIEPVIGDDVTAMEFLPINNNGGQGYGFILYQTELHSLPNTIEVSKVADRAQVLLNSEVIHTIDGMDKAKGYINEKALEKVTVNMENRKVEGSINLEILVENMGRVNYNMVIHKQRKGILGSVYVDGKKQTQWKMYPLEFKSDFMKQLNSEDHRWKQVREEVPLGPNLFKGIFVVDGKPKDTFLNMKGWTKGVCFVNGHNLGRYWEIGPQETLYLPAPWLHSGENEVVLFELHGLTGTGGPEVEFVMEPRLGNPVHRYR